MLCMLYYVDVVCMQAVTVDQSGRVSVTEFTTSLEGALLTEGKSNNCKCSNLLVVKRETPPITATLET